MSLDRIPGNPTFRALAPLAHCEGIAIGPDGALWAGDDEGRVFRIDSADGSTEQVADVSAWILGLAVDGDSNVYVCAYSAGAVLRVDPNTGAFDTYCGGLRAPNWPVFDDAGVLYVSDSGGEDLDDRDGTVVRVPAGGGSFETLDMPPLAFANGMALAPDRTLYVLESFLPRVLTWRDGETSVYQELPGTVPDGLALDDEGGLIVAVYQPNRVLRIPPGGGDPAIVLDDWTGQRMLTPTNAAFFGPERRSLAIATLCGWSIYAIDTPWRGQPLFYPRVP